MSGKDASHGIVKVIQRVLLELDPIGIYFPDVNNVDEYDDVAERIAAGLPRCETESQVRIVIWDAFVDAFSQGIAGVAEDYQEVAHRVWTAWEEARGGRNRSGPNQT